MKILFVDDNIENVFNISRKINGVTEKPVHDYSLYLINEEASVISQTHEENIKEMGFSNKINFFEIAEYEDLKKTLEKNATNFDLIIFDRQLEIPEPNKTGVDLLKSALEKNSSTFFFYLVLTKEARKENIAYEDFKNQGIQVPNKNYIDNSEVSGSRLDDELKERLQYFETHLFLREIKENNRRIVDELGKRVNKSKRIDDLQFLTIKANLDFAFSLLSSEISNLAEEKLFSMVIYWYHLSLENFCEYSALDIIKSNNDNLENAKVKIRNGFFNIGRLDDKKINIDKFIRLYPQDKPKAINKIIAFKNLECLEFGYHLNWYRDKVVHKDPVFYPTINHVLFANLTLSLYVLEEKEEISFSRIESLVYGKTSQEDSKNGFNDLRSLIKYIKN